MVKHHLALVLASLTIVGCSGFKEFEYRHSQTKRAQDAWKAAGPTGASADYKDGWQTGYYDLSMGSDGQVPPVPPKKYWSDKYQSPLGQQCVTDWYAGYQDGVIAADQVGEYEWQLVPSSGVASLPTATVIDYPTYYGESPNGGNHLPETLPAGAPATSEHRHAPQAPPHLNDAVAATAGLDLRTLTGRPSAPFDGSSLTQRAIPAPPAPRRVFERTPQPTRETPLVINRITDEQPSTPPVQVHEPTPAVAVERHFVTRPEQVEVPRGETAIAAPPQFVEDVQARHPVITSHEPTRQFPAANEHAQLAPTANVPEIAAVPNRILSERSVVNWPAVVAPSTTASAAPNAAAEPASPIVLRQQPANPVAELNTHDPSSALAQQPISDQPSSAKTMGGTASIIGPKVNESTTQREEVVRQPPVPTVPVHRARSFGGPVVTSATPIVIRQLDVNRDPIVQSAPASTPVTVSEQPTRITQTVREPERSSVSVSESRETTPRESELTRDTTSPPSPKLTEIIQVPVDRPADEPKADSPELAKAEPVSEQPVTTAAKPKETTDARTDNIANVPRKPTMRITTVKPAAQTRRPIVVAAQPIQIPAYLALNLTPEEAVESPRPNPGTSAANALAKDVSDRSKSVAGADRRTNEAPEPPALPRRETIEPVVKMVAPFPLNSSGTEVKPIVVVARPLTLSEASATRR